MGSKSTSSSVVDASANTAAGSGDLVQLSGSNLVEEGGLQAQGSNVATAGGTVISATGTVTTNTTQTDHGAIANAFGFGQDTAKNAFMFGEKALAAIDNANSRAITPKAETPSLQDALTPAASPGVPVWVWILAALAIAGVVAAMLKGSAK